ncbi:MAG: 50S ribosomal protein L10 [Elusimicrobia bacterium RIFCSPLOWO2_01_FULL_54_10]|nr:MAG: 50S ribosomal protein L10 [Elusimicrobia bacterium RIFCSPLOWO2_01_FULL_54_10]
MPNKKNIESVKALEERLKASPNLVLTTYQGLSTPELNDLRAKLKPLNSEYSVVKNTITSIALKNIGLEEFAKHFTGPTALAFQKGDPAALSKAVVDFAKTNEKLKIVAAYLDGKFLSDKEVKILASLPSREVLITKVAIMLNMPIQMMARVLNAPLQKLAGVIKALEQARTKEAPAATPAPAA